ncbi:DNA primase [Limnoraphis robusta]|uniref:DNA primase n=2 Tax=Limnoraphis robusta TaxID=1118279 RepID=A0A0F5YKR5_9CYAN|nr:DNA primase [Limnoraphis robusta]KKD38765.1 DNA primase [Limnoraphis robusta CS-951]MEA5497113.1 DNA primase [Limnoraphis robusta BA-68 BA1]MEA5523132.1 DNA primase [Limnoraphis robusta CCNP1315]MEA5545373.1 DNA primase [Limnoraphis robusta CCNP1324]
MSTPRIHPDTIEEVKQRADIYDVVSERVVLKRQGKDFAGLCPFHEEKSPSFTVSTSKQMYYCFGCGAGGNAIKFLMELDKTSFADVVLNLARRYQVSVKTEAPEERQALQEKLSLREQLYEILAIATSFYQHTLSQSQGVEALDYLTSQRRLSAEKIQHFQLGYAPKGWEMLYDYLVEQKHFPVHLVEQAGLILPRKKGNGYYDRFRDRLMIPIHDIQGRVIGFGGRTLSDEQPKYLNSPETELFDKGKTLFGLDKAKTAISKLDQAVVVEGYFDVITLHSAGIENVVAALGTALSLTQVRQLLRYTESKQIILNFDADTAGAKAAQRAIGEIENLAYQGSVQLRILNLPAGKDADEFLHSSSSEDYKKLLENAPLWIDWQISQMLVGRDLTKVIEAQQVAQNMVELLNKIEQEVQKTQYIQSCAEILSQGEARLVALFVKTLQKQLQKWRRQREFQAEESSDIELPLLAERSLLPEAELLLLRIYLHCPEHRQTVIEALDSRDLQFSLSDHRFLWRQILEIEEKSELALESIDFISRLQDSLLELSEAPPQLDHLLYLDDTAKANLRRAPLEIRAAIASMELAICKKRRSLALHMWQNTDRTENPELFKMYHDEFLAANQRIQELEPQRCTKFHDLATVPLGELR